MGFSGGTDFKSKRPKLTLSIDKINTGYDENKEADKKRAQNDFFVSKNLGDEDITWIQNAVRPMDPINMLKITQIIGDELVDENKHVSARQLTNGVHEFKTRVFLHKYLPNEQVIKMYHYENDSLDVVFAYEVFIQSAAYFISASHVCDVQVPKVFQYGKYIQKGDDETPATHIFCIVMEKINHDSLRDYLLKSAENVFNCETIANKINDANNCLNTYGIHHGDLNVGNIFIQKHGNAENIKIALIDFGQAGPSTPNSPADDDFSCDKIRSLSNRLKNAAQSGNTITN